MRELAWALERAKTLKDVQQERKLNRDARDEWSSRINSTLAFTQVYFGPDYYSTLDQLGTDFGNLFTKFNPIFDSGRPDPKSAQGIEDAINAFNPKVYAFDLAMQQVIAGNAGTCAAQEPK